MSRRQNVLACLKKVEDVATKKSVDPVENVGAYASSTDWNDLVQRYLQQASPAELATATETYTREVNVSTPQEPMRGDDSSEVPQFTVGSRRSSRLAGMPLWYPSTSSTFDF